MSTIEATLDQKYEALVKLIGTKPLTPEQTNAIARHVDAKAGRIIPLAAFHKSADFSDELKLAVYKDLATAIIKGDYTKLEKPVMVKTEEPEDAFQTALKTLAAVVEARKSAKPAIDMEAVKGAVRDALNNGDFPVARVQDIAETVVRRVAPTLIPPPLTLDEGLFEREVKPRIDSLLGSSVKEILRTGVAPAVAPSTTLEATLASFIPDPIEGFYISPENMELLKWAMEIADTMGACNVLMTGPPGCGKTTTPLHFAAVEKRKLMMMECSVVREPRDWFGQMGSRTGSTYWRDSQFVRCLEAGGHIMVLDDIGRTTDQVRNPLNGMLDDRREAFINERGSFVKVGKGTLFVATINEGRNCTGSTQLDEALNTRFTIRVEVTFIPDSNEIDVLKKRTGVDVKVAKNLVSLANAIREKSTSNSECPLSKPVSTRQLLVAAQMMKQLGPKSLLYTIANHYSDEGGESSERFQVLTMLQGKFPEISVSAKTSAK